MIIIHCPLCGPRGHEEFAYQGDATVRRPADDAPLQDWFEYVFLRDNPRGPHRELWHHVHGCRAYVVVSRDTLTHEITATALAAEGDAP